MTLRNVRNALIVMGAFLALIWILQAANWADGYRLDQEYGILPRNIGRLADIFSAPFLHASWAHIEGNSPPLFVLGVAAAYRGIRRFFAVTVIVAVVSGLAVWFFQSGNAVTIGASGLIFGYFGYVLVRGIIDRNLLDLGIGLLAGFAYWGILQVAIPGTPGISWLAHLGGLIGGVLAAWLLRTRRAPAVEGSPAGSSRRLPGGWTLTGTPASSRPASAGRPREPKPAAARPAATPGGSSAADDLLRQIDDMGI